MKFMFFEYYAAGCPRINDRGKIIRTIAGVRPKMKIRTRVSDGEFGSEVLSEKIFTKGNSEGFRELGKANQDSD